jgi:hypothetical protein
MKTTRSPIVLMLSALLCTAQSPSPAPLRHLEYHYSVLYQQSGESRVSGIGTAGSGVESNDGSAARQGTLAFDVLQAANDGGLVVRATETIEHTDRSMTSLCAVYGNGSVACRTEDRPSDAMEAVLQHLGRDFLDASVIDATGHWTRTFDGGGFKVTSTFSMTEMPDNVHAKVYEHRTIRKSTQVAPGTATLYDRADRSYQDLFANSDEDYTILYDTTMEVPDTIHDEAVDQAGIQGHVRTYIDLNLQKDSFSKPSGGR